MKTIRHSDVYRRTRPAPPVSPPPGSAAENGWIDAQAAADRIGCSKRHVYNLIEAGELGASRRTGARKGLQIRSAGVDAFLCNRETAELE